MRMPTIRISEHAKREAEVRGISLSLLRYRINQCEQAALETPYEEAKVIIRVLDEDKFTDNFSNGNVIVACVDPVKKVVKTVFYRRAEQVFRPCEIDQYVR